MLDGSFAAVAAQVPIQIAEKSFQVALDYLDGKEIEKEIYLPSYLVTKEMAKQMPVNGNNPKNGIFHFMQNAV